MFVRLHKVCSQLSHFILGLWSAPPSPPSPTRSFTSNDGMVFFNHIFEYRVTEHTTRMLGLFVWQRYLFLERKNIDNLSRWKCLNLDLYEYLTVGTLYLFILYWFRIWGFKNMTVVRASHMYVWYRILRIYWFKKTEFLSFFCTIWTNQITCSNAIFLQVQELNCLPRGKKKPTWMFLYLVTFK